MTIGAHGLSMALVLLALAPPTPSLNAQSELYQEGNRLYQQGDFEGALDSYLRVRDAGFESAELYYNVGNAYFKVGELGRAILFYERARRLVPGDADVVANLELARSLTADEIAPLPRFWPIRAASWWLNVFPRSMLIVLVGASYLVATGAAMVLILGNGTLTVWARRTALISAALVVVFGGTLGARELDMGRPEEAVVLSPEVNVQSAPSDDPALQLFVIHEGTKVRVDRRSEEWLEVVLEDGKVGWVPADVVEGV